MRINIFLYPHFLVGEQLASHIKLRYSAGIVDNDVAYQKKKGKGKQVEDEFEVEKQREAAQENHLATLDIFAGCGGLSEGLHQSGIWLPLCLLMNLSLFDHIYFQRTLCPTPFAFTDTGASLTKWAIEYEEPAGDAFKLNHSESLVFINNCNVILR